MQADDNEPDSTINPEHTLNRLRDWFDVVVRLPASARDAWLDEHIASVEDRVALRHLLVADADGDFFDTSAVELDARIVAVRLKPERLIGCRIGAFRVIRLLGLGGMAAVFLGERADADFSQRVAIKLLQRGLYSELEQRLFQRERRVLASLEHPNIARLIDGGVTDAGTPYLVLEYVDGLPITAYAAARTLDVPRRLNLFLAVCNAVEAAHRALIVHRDIKPSNILVTESGMVKLLDFGIAKLIEEDGEATGTDGVFTRDYAAPEQLHGGTITTATDVYGLGVLLFELLLGSRPDIAVAEDGVPRRASSQVRERTGEAASAVPHAHTPDQLRRILRGDLDNIVLKALDPDPARRYASAGALADDVARHLSGRPVLAHSPTRWYRTRKFIRRHRGGVTITAALVLAVFTALGVALWQSDVAMRQARIARAQTARAEAVKDLLVGLFNNEIPERPRNVLPDTATLLAEGAQHARNELSATPGVQSELLLALGHVYTELAQWDKSEPLLDQAIEAARRVEPADPALVGAALSERGQLDLRRSRYPPALSLFDQAIDLQRRADPENLALAHTLALRGQALSESGRHDAALVDYRAALALREKRLPQDDLQTIEAREKIGMALDRAGRRAEAAEPLRAALQAARAKFGEAHVVTTRYMKNYATNLMARQEYAQALALSEQAVRIESTLYPPGHQAIANGLNNLGFLYFYSGHLRDAQTALAKVRDLNRQAGLAQSRGQIIVLTNLAAISEVLDAHDAATLLDEANKMARSVIGTDNEFVRRTALRMARVQFNAQPDAASARALLAAAQPIVQAPQSAAQNHATDEIDALVATGRAHSLLGQDADAETALRAAVAKLPKDHVDPFRMPAVIALIDWQRSHGDAAEAESLLRDFIVRTSGEFAPTHYALGQLQLALAEVLTAANRPAQAAPALAATDAAFAELPATHPWRRRVTELRTRVSP